MHDLDNINTLPENVNVPTDYMDNAEETISDTEKKIRYLADKLRLKFQLAQMDAEDLREDLTASLEKMENSIKQYGKSLETKLDEAEVQTHLGLLEAKERWEITKDYAQKVMDLLKEDQHKAKGFLEEVKLKAALARLETKDFLSEAQKELSQEADHARETSKRILKKLNKSVTEFIDAVS
ncbi:MAG: hypothetical protein ACOH5I_20850 [Oligoflexus sp.]